MIPQDPVQADIYTAPPASLSDPAAMCVNCGRVAAGAYCSQCGQYLRTGRFTVSQLLRQVMADATSLDRGLLHTALALSVRPGQTIREYVYGRTRPYSSPVKYLLICVALGVLSYHVSGLMDAQMARMPLELDSEANRAFSSMTGLFQRYLNVVLVSAVPFLSVFSWLFFRRTGYNLAEHAIFNVYVYAHQNLLLLLSIPVFLLLGRDSMTYTLLYAMLITVYYVWAAMGFFRVSVRSAVVRGLAVNLLGLIVYYVAFAIIMVVIMLAGR